MATSPILMGIENRCIDSLPTRDAVPLENSSRSIPDSWKKIVPVPDRGHISTFALRPFLSYIHALKRISTIVAFSCLQEYINDTQAKQVFQLKNMCFYFIS